MRPILFLVVACISQVGLAQQFAPVRNVLQKCFGPGCQQAAQFGYDTDGALITSVGRPVASQVPTVAPALPEATATASTSALWGKRKTSRAAILEAVDKAVQAGSIDAEQAKVIRRAAYRPRMLSQIEAFVADKALGEGYAMPLGADGEVRIEAIDWEAIGDFIVKIAPLIFKLIELFL